MNSLELITQQRQKERKFLKIFLVSSLLGSLVCHAGAMTLRMESFWSNVPTLKEEEDEIEVSVTEVDTPEVPVQEDLVMEEPPPEPEPLQEAAFAPDITPPPIPLTPESQAPLASGEDAPSKELSAPTADPVAPLTNSAGDMPAAGKASSPITSPNGNGSGFGNATQPTGFAPSGKPGGTSNGKLGGEPGQTAIRTETLAPQPPRSQPQQPVCVSCPKPKFQGMEASPRVDLKIRLDGSVEVRLRKSSGNPEVDRATLETMSKWQFDPKTVPQEGVRKRVRVTYEEEGSNFQRQNEERRRQEVGNRRELEQQRLAEKERRQVEERNRTPATTTTAPPTSPALSSTPAPVPETPAAPAPVEVPLSDPVPAPVEAPLPAPEPAPVEAPAPPPETSPPP